MTRTREEFARLFLREIGTRPTKAKLRALVAWMQAEGLGGRFNPLNSTLATANSTTFNPQGVKNYATFQEGVMATVRTLNAGADRGEFGYKPIRRRLRKILIINRARKVLEAVEASEWGTGGLALKCLREVTNDWDRYRTLPIQQ